MMGTFGGDEGRWSTKAGRCIFAAWVVMDCIGSVQKFKIKISLKSSHCRIIIFSS